MCRIHVRDAIYTVRLHCKPVPPRGSTGASPEELLIFRFSNAWKLHFLRGCHRHSRKRFQHFLEKFISLFSFYNWKRLLFFSFDEKTFFSACFSKPLAVIIHQSSYTWIRNVSRQQNNNFPFKSYKNFGYDVMVPSFVDEAIKIRQYKNDDKAP